MVGICLGRMGIIYCYTNKVNGKKYIGQTLYPSQRKRSHRFNVNEGVKNKFYDAVRCYGWESFSYEVLEETENLDECEVKWISHYNTLVDGYNLNEGGCGNSGHSRALDSIEKQREKMKGIRKSDEVRKKMSDGLKEYYKNNKHPWAGKSHTPENREKLVNATKKWRETRTEQEWEEHKQKLSLSKNNRISYELDGLNFNSQRECVDYIVKRYGLSKNTALEYLKEGRHPSNKRKRGERKEWRASE